MGRKEANQPGRHTSQVERLRGEVAALREENSGLRRQNARLLEQVDRLEQEVAHALKENGALRRQVTEVKSLVDELRRQLNRSSQNSSLPPSADPPGAPPAGAKKGTGKKRGGQPGHPRHERPLVPPEEVGRFNPLRPEACRNCGRSLKNIEGTFTRFQTTEIPEPKPIVTEHQQYCVVCPDCQTETVAPLPPEAREFLGPRALAMVAVLGCVLRLSKRKIAQAMWDLFRVRMAASSAPACEQVVGEAVAGPVAEAQSFVREQAVKYADETGWFHGANRAKAFLWVATTGLVTIFRILSSRSAACARVLLGQAFGVLITDRYKGYDWWPIEWRQLCWAHLKRDIQAMIDAGGVARRVGRSLERQRRKLFIWWYRVRDGTMTRAEFQRRVSQLRKHFNILLKAGSCASHKPTAGTCKDLLRLEPALWTFAYKDGVEPTNNISERSHRHAVILRKICYGTHSDAGARYVERILTVHTSLQQQHRNAVEYLVEAVQAHFAGASPSSILPPTACTSTSA